jgi:Uma2 family endonuclease
MPTKTRTISYPTGDGKPMAETDLHRMLMNDIIDTLIRYYRPEPDVYVSGNLLVFYEEGNKHKHLAPDCFVVKGVPKQLRENYLLWEEKPLDVVFEFTSKSTKTEDTKKKLALYRDLLGVQEYFLFDPYEEYLKPSMQGFQRINDEFHPMPLVNGTLFSEILQLDLVRQGTMLRLRVPATGEFLRNHDEIESAADVERIAREQIEAAEERAQQAEVELARLREMIQQMQQNKNGSHGNGKH